MYSMENYMWGLVAYGIGATLVAWYVTWILGHIRYRHLQNVLCLWVCAFLFTPVLPYTDQPYVAPAFVTLVFDNLVNNDVDGPLRGLVAIASVYSVLILLYIVYSYYLGRRKATKERRNKNKSEQSLAKTNKS
jgi:cytochrome bd-type quinol oxidase subunit 2